MVPSGLRLDGGVQAYLGPPSWWLGSWFRRLGQGWARWAPGCMVCLCKVRDAPRLIIPSGRSSVLAWPWPAPNSPGRRYWVGRWAQRGPHSAPKGPSPVGPTRCPLCLPGQPSPSPLRLHGEPWVTGGKQSPADCPYRTGSDKAGWEELAGGALAPCPHGCLMLHASY